MLVRLDGEPGTSNPRMTADHHGVSRELRAIPGVENVGAHVGRAVRATRWSTSTRARSGSASTPDADYDATMASIKDTVDRATGVEHDVVTYSAQKIRDVGALERGRRTRSRATVSMC